MTTIKLKLENEIDILKEQRSFNNVVRLAFNRFQDSYSENMGRTAKDAVFMFKLLLLKTESGLSDEGLIKMVNVNM